MTIFTFTQFTCLEFYLRAVTLIITYNDMNIEFILLFILVKAVNLCKAVVILIPVCVKLRNQKITLGVAPSVFTLTKFNFKVSEFLSFLSRLSS